MRVCFSLFEMKTTQLCIFILALTLGSQIQAEPASQDQIRKEILETNARMTQAANSLNTEAFFAFIDDSDQCRIIQNGTLFKTRREAFDAVKRATQMISKIDRHFENPQVTVISNDTALLTSLGSVTATLTNGTITESRFAVSILFVRKEGVWKLLHGHYSAAK